MPPDFELGPEREVKQEIKRFHFDLRRLPENQERRSRLSFTIALIVLVLFYTFVYSSPSAFPVGKIVTVEKGASLGEITELFEKNSVVRSALWLKIIIRVAGVQTGVYAGDYFFPKRKNILGVARMITTGNFGLDSLRVTLPEGTKVEEMEIIFASKFSAFDSTEFLDKAIKKEGYLFPDTYFFLPNVKTEEIIKTLESTFFIKIAKLEDDIEKFGEPLHSVVTMASILEKEARTMETKRIIAGILWTRIDIGIALQVDVTFDYINGKNTYQLTLEDLKIDSPYNTYKYAGLPPGPITNPGYDSLYATVNPIQSEYLYFLSDRSGIMHYSKTFDEHKRKKSLYIY